MREVQIHSVYRHYKGNLYYVIALAWHTETAEKMVVYHALYGDYETFVRPMDMFLSEVEEVAKNPTGQRYRFELMEEYYE
ncbi:DUF1653 domain-containing protein [Paenibacillus xylaniclasticus]|uniref:DUF1653 domain-containing protein n=1 Tax=Paenibacillus xylaniclasticus TaxID=588083 RepID=UPI000FD6EFB2|nr:hypothetical protein PCURB6_26680 [Paenibacillus curdlanolyticus]